MKRKVKRLLALLLSTALILGACYVNKETGRRQLLVFPASEEASLGRQTFLELKNQTPQSSDPEQNALVSRVGQKISGVVSLPNAQWEFVTFKDDKTVNAFCLPGGKIGVYTGILPITQSEAGLAAVMGHEVAHATARHGGERMSQQLLVGLGGLALEVALRDQPQQTIALAMTAYGIGTTVGAMLPFSRSHELEADKLGMMYMARAGYDPHEAVDLWKRMKAESTKRGGKPPEFLSTHPSDERRIAELEKHLPEAMAAYEKTR